MEIQRLKNDDYHIGIALLSSVKSKQRKIALFCDTSNIIYISSENRPKGISSDQDVFVLEPEIYLFTSLKIFDVSGILYLTYTPLFESLIILANSLVKKIVYIETEVINNEVEQLCLSANIDLQKYDGNLHWIKDYIFLIQQAEIF